MTVSAVRTASALASLLLTCLATAVGCEGDTAAEQIRLAKLSQSCLINSDCDDPLVCAFKLCHLQCESSRDCSDGSRCVASDRPHKVCQLESEKDCESHVDCASPLVCGIDGECRDQCFSSADCITNQICVSGTCADEDELDDDGTLPSVSLDDRPAEGRPCTYASECEGALLCREGLCLPECRDDIDCPPGAGCSEGRCTTGNASSCIYHSECDTDAGEICAGGSCVCSCLEDRDCPTSMVCDGCGCERDTDAPTACYYNSDCTDPGQICSSGECRCECQADLDCPATETCDGCGCVIPGTPDGQGIVQGSVIIKDDLDLEHVRGVKAITGTLVVSASQMSSLGNALLQLQKVGHLRVEASTLTSLAGLEELQEVTGSVTIRYNGNLAGISLPSLATVGGELTIERNAITSAEFPSLESVGGKLAVAFDNSLTELELPKLQTAGSVSINDTQLTSIDLPSLISTAGPLSLSSNPFVDTVELPVLQTVGGSLSIDGVGSSVNTLDVHSLAAIDGKLELTKTLLTELDSLNPDISGSLGATGLTDVALVANADLSQCHGDALLAALATVGFSGTVDHTGSVPCASCNGVTCED